jgi:hypothetical protein
MLVCRVTLGYSCRTLGAPASPDRRLEDADHAGRNVFSSTIKKLNMCPLVPANAAFENHSLVAELSEDILRYREFLVFHSETVPMYLIAYKHV